MVDILKIAGNELWLITTMCLYLLTSSAFPNILAQEEDKRVTNGNSPFNMALASSSAGKAFSGTTSPLNNSTDGALSASNSTHFLKYNNLGNNYNKDASASYNFPEYSGPSSAYGQRLPSSSTYPNSYNYYPYSFGTSPYPQLTSPSYYGYPQSSAPFSSSGASNYPLSPSPSGLYPQSLFPPSIFPPSSPVQLNSFPIPPPSVFPPARYPPDAVQDSALGSDDPVVSEESKMVSPWFPSIPASDCEGIFEFTLEGTANLQAENLKTGNHKITIKMTSESPDLINGQLWVDKTSNNDRGSKFDVDKTFNNCRVVTASSPPDPTTQPQSSSSLLNSLLDDLPDEDLSADEQLPDRTEETGQEQEDLEDDAERNGKSKIASLE
jgi:hypothetical protein